MSNQNRLGKTDFRIVCYGVARIPHVTQYAHNGADRQILQLSKSFTVAEWRKKLTPLAEGLTGTKRQRAQELKANISSVAPRSDDRPIKYFISVSGLSILGMAYLEKVTGQPIVFKGFEPWKFCVRKTANNLYVVDELSTGFAVPGRKLTREEAIDAAQKLLAKEGVVAVKRVIAKTIATYGRANKLEEVNTSDRHRAFAARRATVRRAKP